MPIAPAPAVLRAGEVLRLLAATPTEAFSVSEIARTLELPRATCDAVAQALTLSGLLVRRDRDLRYMLGPGAIAVGDAARVANPVLRVAAVQAEHLARELGACTAVSLRRGDSSAVAEVFDHGPAFGLRAQVGQTIGHVPPFGAAYVAWHDDEIDAWLERTPRPLRKVDRRRLEAALDQVRRLGFSITVASPRRLDLEAALSTLAERPDAEPAKRARDEVVSEMIHRDYLASELDDETPRRVTLMAAPVFDQHGRAAATILLLGPDHDLTGRAVRRRGAALVDAATRATLGTGGAAPSTFPTGSRHLGAAHDPPSAEPRRASAS